MAGKEKYTAPQIIAAIGKGQTCVGAAQVLGCDRKTVASYVQRYPSIAAALDAQRQEMVDVAEGALRRAILAGESWAVNLVLKTQGKSRGYVERVEGQHTGEIVHRVIYGDDGTHNPTA